MTPHKQIGLPNGICPAHMYMYFWSFTTPDPGPRTGTFVASRATFMGCLASKCRVHYHSEKVAKPIESY